MEGVCGAAGLAAVGAAGFGADWPDGGGAVCPRAACPEAAGAITHAADKNKIALRNFFNTHPRKSSVTLAPLKSTAPYAQNVIRHKAC
jgi:hypothetical protein